MGRLAWCSTLIAACALLCPRGARAEPGTATLYVQRGSGASGCEDSVALRERINRIAEREAIVRSGSARLRLSIQFEHTEQGFHALLHVTSRDADAPAGNRELSDVGPTCLALDEAIAVSIALLLDDIPARTPPPPEEDAPPPPLRAPLPYSERPRPSATFDASALTSAGIVGSSTFGFDLGVDFRVTKPAVGKGFAPFLTIGAGMFALLEDVEPTLGGEIHVNLVALRTPVCFSFHLANQAFGASLCGFPAVGPMIASGRGYSEDATAYAPWFALGASAVAEAAIVGPLSFTGRVMFVAPPVRPTFVFRVVDSVGSEGTQPAFEPFPVGVAAGVGVRAHIP